MLNIYSCKLPFFWDTILTSTITQYFYHHGFQNFIIPAQLDAGHPPLFYIYFTTLYHLFGDNLMTAHWGMLPFSILGIGAFIRLMHIFSFDRKQQYVGILLFFAIPAVATQYTLISYDAALLSLYLAALVAYFDQKKVLFSILLIILLGVSMRGLFCLIALSSTIFFIEKNKIISWLKWNLYMLPSVVFIIIWYAYHYQQTGWLFATNAEGWAQQRSFVDIKGLLKNGFSIARCFIDYGIIILSLISIFYWINSKKINQFTILWLVPFVLFTIGFLPFSNPINHRYFLIIYTLMLFPVVQFLSIRKTIFSFCTIGILLIGHFLIYPVPISNGWDCTLLHTSYSINRNKMIKSIDKNKIDRTQIGTVFPMNTSLYQTDMTKDTTRMINIHGKDIQLSKYVLYSNVCNDFSDEQLLALKKWNPLLVKHFGMTNFILFENPTFYSK